MREDQTIEWKESWRDEYLKWICGFANAEGGRLVVGRNDKGEVVGLVDYFRKAAARSGRMDAAVLKDTEWT